MLAGVCSLCVLPLPSLAQELDSGGQVLASSGKSDFLRANAGSYSTQALKDADLNKVRKQAAVYMSREAFVERCQTLGFSEALQASVQEAVELKNRGVGEFSLDEIYSAVAEQVVTGGDWVEKVDPDGAAAIVYATYQTGAGADLLQKCIADFRIQASDGRLSGIGPAGVSKLVHVPYWRNIEPNAEAVKEILGEFVSAKKSSLLELNNWEIFWFQSAMRKIGFSKAECDQVLRDWVVGFGARENNSLAELQAIRKQYGSRLVRSLNDHSLTPPIDKQIAKYIVADSESLDVFGFAEAIEAVTHASPYLGIAGKAASRQYLVNRIKQDPDSLDEVKTHRECRLLLDFIGESGGTAAEWEEVFMAILESNQADEAIDLGVAATLEFYASHRWADSGAGLDLEGSLKELVLKALHRNNDWLVNGNMDQIGRMLRLLEGDLSEQQQTSLAKSILHKFSESPSACTRDMTLNALIASLFSQPAGLERAAFGGERLHLGAVWVRTYWGESSDFSAWEARLNQELESDHWSDDDRAVLSMGLAYCQIRHQNDDMMAGDEWMLKAFAKAKSQELKDLCYECVIYPLEGRGNDEALQERVAEMKSSVSVTASSKVEAILAVKSSKQKQAEQVSRHASALSRIQTLTERREKAAKKGLSGLVQRYDGLLEVARAGLTTVDTAVPVGNP